MVYDVLMSTQFTAISMLAYADIPDASSSHASAFAGTFQQLSMSFGVATTGHVTANFFTSKVTERFDMLPGVHRAVFLLGCVTILSAAVFLFLFLFLRRGDGDNVSGHHEALAKAVPEQSQ